MHIDCFISVTMQLEIAPHFAMIGRRCIYFEAATYVAYAWGSERDANLFEVTDAFKLDMTPLWRVRADGRLLIFK